MHQITSNLPELSIQFRRTTAARFSAQTKKISFRQVLAGTQTYRKFTTTVSQRMIVATIII